MKTKSTELTDAIACLCRENGPYLSNDLVDIVTYENAFQKL